MQELFSISDGQETLEPISLAEVVTKLTNHEIAEDDMIYLEETDEWVVLSQFGPIRKRLEIMRKLQPVKAEAVVAHAVVEEVHEEKLHNSLNSSLTDYLSSEYVSSNEDLSFESFDHMSHEEETMTRDILTDDFDHVSYESISFEGERDEGQSKTHQAEDEIESEIEISENSDFSASEDQDHVEENLFGKMIRIENGQAVIEVAHDVAERIALKISDHDLSSLQIESQEISVQAGEASELFISGDRELTAGQEHRFEIIARDEFGNLDMRYNRTLLVRTEKGDEEIEIREGHATYAFSSNKAGAYKIEVLNMEDGLRADYQVVVNASTAVRLMVETPSEARVGSPFKILVRAVDQYGNLVSNFNGSLDVELIGASASHRPQIVSA